MINWVSITLVILLVASVVIGVHEGSHLVSFRFTYVLLFMFLCCWVTWKIHSGMKLKLVSFQLNQPSTSSFFSPSLQVQGYYKNTPIICYYSIRNPYGGSFAGKYGTMTFQNRTNKAQMQIRSEDLTLNNIVATLDKVTSNNSSSP